MHICDIIIRYLEKTEIQGSINRNGIPIKCAFYEEDGSLFFFTNERSFEGASPTSGYKSKYFLNSWRCGPTKAMSSLSGIDLESFLIGGPYTSSGLKGRWVKALKDNPVSISSWKEGEYRKIINDDGTKIEGGYSISSTASYCEIMPEGFEPEGKHISNYTQELQRGCFREGSIVTIGGDKLVGGLYRSTANGYYYFLHNEMASHTRGCKPSESLPADCPYKYGWDIGNQATPFDQIKPKSFIPTSVLVESWNEKPKFLEENLTDRAEEVITKKSDPSLDYLVVGMGKPAEIQPVVMFSRTKDKRVMAPLEAMQPVLQISKLKTNK